MAASKTDLVERIWQILGDRDFERAAEYISPEVELHSPRGIFCGYDGLREFLEQRGDDSPTFRRLDSADIDVNHVLTRVEVELPSPNDGLKARVAHLYTFDANNRLTSWRIFIQGRREALAWLREQVE